MILDRWPHSCPVAILVFLCVCPTAHTAGPRQIAVTASVTTASGSKDCLWFVDPASSRKQRVLSADRIDDIAWSPDGSLLLASLVRKGRYFLAFSDPAHKVWQYALRQGMAHEPSWAQSEKGVVWGDYVDGIYYYDLESAPSSILDTTGFTFDHGPVFSPDGRKLAYVHQEWGTRFYVSLIPNFQWNQIPYKGNDHYNGHLNPQIKIVARGRSEQNENMDLQWTPDGTRLVFSTLKDRGTIYVATVDGPPFQVLKLKPPPGTELAGNARLSPKGGRIAIGAYQGLYVMNIDGTDSAKIWDKDVSSQYSWSPDDRRVAVGLYNSPSTVVIINVQTGQARTVASVDGFLEYLDW